MVGYANLATKIDIKIIKKFTYNKIKKFYSLANPKKYIK
jgi:hypothetical protein